MGDTHIDSAYFNPTTCISAPEEGASFRVSFPLPSELNVTGVRVFFNPLNRYEEVLSYPLTPTSDELGVTVFSALLTAPACGVWQYRFEAYRENEILFFGRGEDGTAVRGDWLPMWQLTVTKRGYKTPDWAKGGIIYHIFVDRFFRGRATPFNKPQGYLHSSWNQLPDTAAPNTDYRADDFFGGNFDGIIQKLPYIKSLGTTIIYLSPIFEASSNHRYDTGDYLKLDSLLGTEAEFCTLVKKANELGMEIMLDGVFNHSGSDSIYFNKQGNYPTVGAYQSPDSPYADWYEFQEFPDTYSCWWGITVVPTLNKSAKGYQRLLFGKNGVLEKWQHLGIKGWRLDVVDELPEFFVDELRSTIKRLDDNCLVLGEVWEDASVKFSYGTLRPYFTGGQLDGVMNYPFKEAVLNYCLTGNATEFVDSVSLLTEHYPKQALDCCMTLLGTHDTVRALNALAEVNTTDWTKAEKMRYAMSARVRYLAKRRLLCASVLQYTLPGIPSVYYGDEVGIEGLEDPTNRKPFPWGAEDAEILAHYRRLGEIRSSHRDLFCGNFRFERRDDLVVFYRYCDGKKLTVAVNCSNNAANLPISACKNLYDGCIMRAGELCIKPLDFRLLLDL